ncbi:Protein CBG26654 [Caenorhabditis briggsae]|uniref:RNA-directed DNA polymerase n=1 Tax=Caenorhabditis briggsae TaxID=6238 RepID=B6IE15_CAEBR|nr:Protein CBG26654 [Caenorhabditis briggsae]CAS01079.1 Protein CBG26654 [Caenorhabditis briggsae]
MQAYRNTSSFGQADALSRLIEVNKQNLEEEDRVIASVEAEVDAEHHGITRHLPITAANIGKATQSDPITAAVIQYVQQGNWPKIDKSSPIFPFYSRRESLSIVNGTLMFGHRIVIPAQLRQRVKTTLHKTHPGQQRMKQLARSYIYWPHIDSEIESLVRNCHDCQAAAKNPVKTTLQPWPTASIPLERIHIDYAGPIDGTYYLVFVDAFSKWPEILPTRTITASRTIELLTPIFARYGNPQTLVSDNGTQFVSSTFQQFCASRGIKHLRSPPFHPQSNGQAERFVDTFKRALVKLKREETTQEALQTFLMAYRSTPCASSPGQLSPAENFLKRKMRTIMDLMLPTHLPIDTSSKSDKMKQQFDRHHGAKWRCYSVGDPVFVKDYRSPNTWLPGIVIARSGSVKYTVRCNGLEWIRHVYQLRRRDHLPSSSHLLDCFDLPTTPPPPSDAFILPTSPSLDCFPPSPCQDVPSTTTLVPRTTTSLPSTTTCPPSTTTIALPPSTTTTALLPRTTTLPPSTTTVTGSSSSLMPAPQAAAPTLRRSSRTVRAPAQLEMDPSRSTYR